MSGAWLAIVNGAAGGGRCAALAPAAVKRLRAAGLKIELAHTSGPGDAKRLAKEGYARGTRRFVAVGGDGTSYEIVNGLLPEAIGAVPENRPCLGFLPLGTGNSFLKDFSERGVEHATQAMQQGRRRPCDVVCVTHDKGVFYYLNLLSVGFVADVAALVNRRFKRFGTAGYGLGVVMQTAALSPSPIRMRLDAGELWAQRNTFVSFCNSRYTGGRMMMAPFADTADGKLDVIVAGDMGRLRLLAAFPHIFKGTHVHLPKVVCSQAREVVLDFATPIDLMIDGEVERHKPERLTVVQGALDVSV